MIRGIHIKIDHNINYYFDKLMDGIPYEDYNWLVYFSDSYLSFEKMKKSDFEGLFAKGNVFKRRELCDRIRPDSYIVFLTMAATKNNYEVFPKLHSYKEFLESDLEILLSLYDNNYLNVYFKDFNITESFKVRAEEIGAIETEYITDENDREYFDEFKSDIHKNN